MKIAILDNKTLDVLNVENGEKFNLVNLLIDFINADLTKLETIIEKTRHDKYDKVPEGLQGKFLETLQQITQGSGLPIADLIKNSLVREFKTDSMYGRRILKSAPPGAQDVFMLANLAHYVDFFLKKFMEVLRVSLLTSNLPENINRDVSTLSSIEVKFSFNEYQGILYDTFEFETLEQFFTFAASKAIQSKVLVKECANCNKLFIPASRSDEIYCDRIFQGNRTCKQVGYENKNEFIKAYRTAYKTRNAIKNRNIKNNPHAEKDFKEWVYSAKVKLEEAQRGEISFEEFKKWLKK